MSRKCGGKQGQTIQNMTVIFVPTVFSQHGRIDLNDGLDVGEVGDVGDDLGTVNGKSAVELFDGGERDERNELVRCG